jgi:hypothetical protein
MMTIASTKKTIKEWCIMFVMLFSGCRVGWDELLLVQLEQVGAGWSRLKQVGAGWSRLEQVGALDWWLRGRFLSQWCLYIYVNTYLQPQSPIYIITQPRHKV